MRTVTWIVLLAASPSIVLAQTDYPLATWNPAHTNNYTATARTPSQIRWIVLHTTEDDINSCLAAQNFFHNSNGVPGSGEGVSAHYVICRDGSVVQMVRDDDIAHHAGKFSYNQQSIGIEHQRQADTSQVPTPEQYASSVVLVRWLVDRYAVDGVFPSGTMPTDPSNGNGIIGHIQVPGCATPPGGGASCHTDPRNWNWETYKTLFFSSPCAITQSTPLADAAINLPWRFSWSISGTCTNIDIAFETDTNLPQPRFFAGPLPEYFDLSSEYWLTVRNVIGVAPTYYWSVGVRNEPLFNRLTPWRAFTVQCTSNVDCNDNDVCTNDICNNGVCRLTNNTNACDDGDACTTDDRCLNGACAGAARDCDDGNPCTTDGSCVNGACQRTNNTNVCNDNNACTTNDHCSNGTCGGSLPAVTTSFVSALPTATASAGTTRALSRTTKNEVRLDFSANLLPVPGAGVIRVRELLANGAFGADIGANFTATITDTPGGAVDAARLILRDNASNLLHRKWYQIDYLGCTWPGVGPFCLQFVVQAGDCDGSGSVSAADLTCVNAKVPTLPANAALDANFTKDINGAGGISAADLTATNGQIPSLPVAKPTGHTCP